MAEDKDTAAEATTAEESDVEVAEEPQVKLNRQEFLNLAWLASLGIISVNLGVVTYFFALPRFREGEFGGTFSVGGVSGLPEAGASPAENPRGKFWLARTDDGVLALYKVCTHLGCLYSWLDEEGIFRCPCHGSQFEPNGDYLSGPAPRSLDRFVVQLVDNSTGEVIAETDLESGGPVPLQDNPNLVVQVDTGSLVRGKPK